MKVKSMFFILVIFSVSVAFAQSAEELFDAKCSSCHIKTKPTDTNSLVAPAIMGVMRHIKMEFDNKDSAVEFMSDYVLNPSKSKAICMPQKIEKFGLMPSLKGVVSKEEAVQISSWLYDNFPPKDFRGMRHRRNGKRGIH